MVLRDASASKNYPSTFFSLDACSRPMWALLSRKRAQVLGRSGLHSVKRAISKPSSDVLSTYSNVMFQPGLFIVEACASF